MDKFLISRYIYTDLWEVESAYLIHCICVYRILEIGLTVTRRTDNLINSRMMIFLRIYCNNKINKNANVIADIE